MSDILVHMQKCKPFIKTFDLEPFTQTDYQLFPTLIGGDQLTTSHARGCIKFQDNAENSLDKLSGFLPVVEDWHAKVCFLQVSSSDIFWK